MMEEQVTPPAAEEPREETTTPERKRSQFEVAMLIADRLGETQELVRQQVLRTVKALGRTQALALLEETLHIEATGGMMLPDGSRRRTPGGVFFVLVKAKGQPKQRPWMKTGEQAKQRPESSADSPSKLPTAPALPLFTWSDRITIIEDIGAERGTANVKITVIGRPGKIVDKGSCMVMAMQATKIPALPKGLPSPPNPSTNYVVYIAAKQWRKVEEAMKDPEDILIIEGFPQIDTQTDSIAVFATNTTTKKLQSAQRQASEAS